jgi:hypothetical protein
MKVLSLVLLSLVVVACSQEAPKTAFKCPPIDEESFWLPDTQSAHLPALLMKAESLNVAGQCAIEGSFGSSSKKFYIAVTKTGQLGDAKNLFFSLDELRQ